MCRGFICLASTNAPIKISQTNLKHKLVTANKPSSSSRKRPRSTTNVRFSSEEPQQIVVSSSSASSSDNDDLWYDNESMNRMKLDAMSTVAMAMMGRSDHCTDDLRGLEEHFVATSFQLTAQAKEKRRRQQIESYVNAVLDEQVEQWANDTKDPTKLAQVASNLSKPQKERAVMIALNDQNEVLFIE